MGSWIGSVLELTIPAPWACFRVAMRAVARRTCPVMCGSGALTGSTKSKNTACCGAVLGTTTIPRICAVRVAAVFVVCWVWAVRLLGDLALYPLLFESFTLFPAGERSEPARDIFTFSAKPPSGWPCRKWRGWPKRVLRGLSFGASPPCSGVRENAGDFAPRDRRPDTSPDRECGALLGNPMQLGRPSLGLGPVEIRALWPVLSAALPFVPGIYSRKPQAPLARKPLRI